MAKVTGFPTSSDIYLELEGKKVAVVQSYSVRTTIGGQCQYVLELTRLYATDDAISDGIDFYAMRDFSLVICKPDRRVIYSGCNWSAIAEEGKLGAMVAEKVSVLARKRIEVRA